MTTVSTAALERLAKRLVVTLLLTSTSLAFADQCNKTVRWNDDPPYTFQDSDKQIRGITADILQEAFKRLNCSATYLELPWARALHKLEAGTLDILSGALRTPEREQFAYYSRPINRSPNVLFVKKNALSEFNLSQLSDIKNSNFRLGAQIGVIYGSEYATLVQQPEFSQHLVMINSRRGAWQMINAGRLDGIIADEITGILELEQLGLSARIVKSTVVVSSEASAFALSKKSISPEFAKRFDQALNDMLADGSYQRIMENYLPCTVSAEKLGCK